MNLVKSLPVEETFGSPCSPERGPGASSDKCSRQGMYAELWLRFDCNFSGSKPFITKKKSCYIRERLVVVPRNCSDVIFHRSLSIPVNRNTQSVCLFVPSVCPANVFFFSPHSPSWVFLNRNDAPPIFSAYYVPPLIANNRFLHG